MVIPVVLVAAAGTFIGRHLRMKYVQSKMPTDEQMHDLVDEAGKMQGNGTSEQDLRSHFRKKGFPREIVDMLLEQVGIKPAKMTAVTLVFIGVVAIFMLYVFLYLRD